MLTLEVHNLDGLPNSTYHYTVKVNNTVIAQGEIQHFRDNGWMMLISKILDHEKDKYERKP